jgi:hypothetical protein
MPCGPSLRALTISSTVERSSPMCAWHALTLSRTSLSIPSLTPSVGLALFTLFLLSSQKQQLMHRYGLHVTSDTRE